MSKMLDEIRQQPARGTGVRLRASGRTVALLVLRQDGFQFVRLAGGQAAA